MDYMSLIITTLFLSYLVYDVWQAYFKRGNVMTDEQLMSRYVTLARARVPRKDNLCK